MAQTTESTIPTKADERDFRWYSVLLSTTQSTTAKTGEYRLEGAVLAGRQIKQAAFKKRDDGTLFCFVEYVDGSQEYMFWGARKQDFVRGRASPDTPFVKPGDDPLEVIE